MGILQVHVNLKLNGAPQTSLHPDQVPELWGHSADGFFTVFKQHLVQVASFWLTGGEREMKSKRHLAMELRQPGASSQSAGSPRFLAHCRALLEPRASWALMMTGGER